MLKTEIVVDRMYFPPRRLVVSGSLPACEDGTRFREYRRDAKRMLARLAEDFKPIGVEQVLAASLHFLATPKGKEWLKKTCANANDGSEEA